MTSSFFAKQPIISADSTFGKFIEKKKQIRYLKKMADLIYVNWNFSGRLVTLPMAAIWLKSWWDKKKMVLTYRYIFCKSFPSYKRKKKQESDKCEVLCLWKW